MSEELVDRYRAIWKKQQKHRKDLPNEYKDNNLVLAKVDGSCYSPRRVQTKIQRCREKGGFPDWITSHVFRNTFAPLFLAENKNIKALQKILGHSSYVITVDTYSYFMEEDFVKAGQDISRAVDSIFSVQD